MENIKDLVKKIQEFDFKSSYKRERNLLIKIKFHALYHLQSDKLLKDIVLYDEAAIHRQIRSFVKYYYERLIEKEKSRLPNDQKKAFKHAI